MSNLNEIVKLPYQIVYILQNHEIFCLMKMARDYGCFEKLKLELTGVI